MHDGAFFDAPDGDGVDLDALEVSLQFCVGRIELTLAQLRRIAAGSLVDLDAPAQACVEILANGQRIGRGELVEIDDRLAVEITEFSSERA